MEATAEGARKSTRKRTKKTPLLATHENPEKKLPLPVKIGP